MAATWYLLYFGRETEHIEGMCFEVKVPYGACVHTAGFHKSKISAGDHRQRFLVSDHSVLTCIV